MTVASKPWKIMVAVIVVALVATSFVGCLGGQQTAIDKIKSRGKLIIGTDATFPPFEQVNTTTHAIEGFDIDIMQKVADRLNVTLEIKNMAFDTIIGGVVANQIDIAAAGMTITDDRNKSILFSDPYINANQAIVIANTTTDIKNDTDLAGKRIAVNLGTTGDIWATENLVDTGKVYSISRFGTAGDMFAELTSGRVDAVIIDSPVADAFVSKNPGYNKVFVISTNEFYGFGMNKASTDLRDLVNQVLAEMKASGEYQNLVNKWF
jgi:ABC-type amino acid transport substrate-binding protein